MKFIIIISSIFILIILIIRYFIRETPPYSDRYTQISKLMEKIEEMEKFAKKCFYEYQNIAIYLREYANILRKERVKLILSYKKDSKAKIASEEKQIIYLVYESNYRGHNLEEIFRSKIDAQNYINSIAKNDDYVIAEVELK